MTTINDTTYTVAGYQVYHYMLVDIMDGFRRWMSYGRVYETIEDCKAWLDQLEAYHPNVKFELREVREYPQPDGVIHIKAVQF